MSNTNLNDAKKAKNDEFYTMYKDIENELQHYPGAFEGKIVYCNCDNPEWSNFWKYFHLNFEKLGLKKLISTHYEKDVEANGHPYKMEYEGGNDADITAGVKTPLTDDGDFASDECIETLKEADIVVTNPPFSLFKKYIQVLFDNKKRFLAICNKQCFVFKNIFPHIKNGDVMVGYTAPKEFFTIDKKKEQFGNIGWLACVDGLLLKEVPPTHRKLLLTKTYNQAYYQTYDNFEAINVNRVCDIPRDYAGIMGVPVSFIDKYNPKQFELIGHSGDKNGNYGDGVEPGGCTLIDWKRTYSRVFIKNRHPEPPVDNYNKVEQKKTIKNGSGKTV